MDNNEKYFIYLINSFLNKNKSKFDDAVSFDEIYRLAKIHNVVGIITNQILTFNKNELEQINNISYFRQQLGLTLIDFQSKIDNIKILRDTFNSCEIPFIFVKGTRTRELYPTPELRTSSDIDIYYPEKYYNKLNKALKESNFEITSSNQKLILLKSSNQTIEIHSTDDYDNEYFKDLFSIAIHKTDFEYELSLEDELLFCLCHIAKHINSCGAGVRMFMDIDVIIRAIASFNYNSLMIKAKSANIETFTKYSLTLVKRWFNTPFEYREDGISEEILLSLENSTISGGCFGFEKRGLGDYYVDKAIKKSGKNSILSKLKAIIILFFPSPKYLMDSYLYSKKHPILLPVAWLQRLYLGIFKHSSNSKNTVAGILKTDNSVEEYRKLKNELEL